MPQHIRRAAHQLRGRDALDLHSVVGHQAVSALDQLHGGLALADATVAKDQNALAVDLHQHAVAGDPGGQIGLEGRDQAGDDGGRGVLTPEDGDIVLPGHLQALGQGLQIPGNHQGRDLIREEMVKYNGPLLAAELLEIAGLHVAENLQAHGLEMVKKTGQLQAGTADVVHSDVNPVKILGLVQGDQLKVLHQLRQGDGVNMLQGASPLRHYTLFRVSSQRVKNFSSIRKLFLAFFVDICYDT